MWHQGRVTPSLFVVVLVFLLALAGCRGREASPPPPVPQPPPAAAPPTAESATPSAPAPAVVNPTPPTPAAKAAAPGEATRAGEAFRWTDKPTLAGIPEGPIVGELKGRPFRAQAVRLQREEDGLLLTISNLKPSNPSGPLSKNTAVELTFSLPEGKPGELVLEQETVKIRPNHAYYHYPSDTGPVSVNCPYAVALKITSWTLQTDPANADILGEVSGRIAICFNDDARSWVAGAFRGVYFKW